MFPPSPPPFSPAGRAMKRYPSEYARQVDEWERSGRNPEYAPEFYDDDDPRIPYAKDYAQLIARRRDAATDTADTATPVGAVA